MKFSKIILSCLLMFSLAGAGTAWACGGKHKKFDVEKRVEKMTEKLDLTQQQVPQVRSIMQEKQQAMKSLHDQAKTMRGEGADRETIKSSLKNDRMAIYERTKGQMQSVLTAEQFAKFESMKKQRKEKMKKRYKDKSDLHDAI